MILTRVVCQKVQIWSRRVTHVQLNRAQNLFCHLSNGGSIAQHTALIQCMRNIVLWQLCAVWFFFQAYAQISKSSW